MSNFNLVVGAVAVEIFESGNAHSDWRNGEAAQVVANRVRAERVALQALALLGVVLDKVVVFGNRDGAWADAFLGQLFVGRLKLEGGPWADTWKVWSAALGTGQWREALEEVVLERIGWRLQSFASVVGAEWLEEQYRAGSEVERVFDRAINIHGYDVFLDGEPVEVKEAVEASAEEVEALEQELGPVSEWTADDQELWEREVGWNDQDEGWQRDLERALAEVRRVDVVEEHDAKIERAFFLREED